MSINFPLDSSAIPGTQSAYGSIFMSPLTSSIKLARRPLMAGPIPRDPKLPLDHPDQSFTDCRTIEGWTDTIYRLMQAAWGLKDSDDSFRFGQDYGLLPQDPKQIKGTVIVYEILSMVPGKRGKHGREIKPLLREVIPQATTTSTSTTSANAEIDPGSTVVVAQENPQSTGRTWVWAQRFDAVVRFTIYGDTWGRAKEYCGKTFDLIQTYTGIFRQAGLANLLFRQQGQDILQDPPRVQEFPNQQLFYNVTIERQTRATYAQIQQVLISAGVLDPLSGAEDDLPTPATVEGVPESPILPSSQAQ